MFISVCDRASAANLIFVFFLCTELLKSNSVTDPSVRIIASLLGIKCCVERVSAFDDADLSFYTSSLCTLMPAAATSLQSIVRGMELAPVKIALLKSAIGAGSPATAVSLSATAPTPSTPDDLASRLLKLISTNASREEIEVSGVVRPIVESDVPVRQEIFVFLYHRQSTYAVQTIVESIVDSCALDGLPALLKTLQAALRTPRQLLLVGFKSS
jgi:hypothetical protein